MPRLGSCDIVAPIPRATYITPNCLIESQRPHSAEQQTTGDGQGISPVVLQTRFYPCRLRQPCDFCRGGAGPLRLLQQPLPLVIHFLIRCGPQVLKSPAIDNQTVVVE